MLVPLFVSKIDASYVNINYQMTHKIDPMLYGKNVENVMELNDVAEKALIISMIVPFALMLVFSFSMDRVWSFYLML